MLNQHPSIAVPYESHFFNTFQPILKYYGNISQKRHMEYLVDDILSTDVMNDWDPPLTRKDIFDQLEEYDFGMLFDAMMQAWTLKCGKKRWGEKTPHHIHYWREISEIYPNAKFLHIVRDGRDVSLSFLEARFGPKSIYNGAVKWKQYLQLVGELQSMLTTNRFLEIKYEDLIENPEFCLTKICNFLGEEYDSKMLLYYENKNLYKTDKRNQENLQRKLISDNKYKWMQQMSDAEVDLFESIAGPELEKYDYTLRHTDLRHPSLPMMFYYRFIQGPFRKITAMLNNKKGQRDALIRLGIKVRALFRYHVLGNPLISAGRAKFFPG
ncbi:sulfotransferase [bacterium]|nr:sulfotransferase [bacterium]